jgi:PAS domain-containing protein
MASFAKDDLTSRSHLSFSNVHRVGPRSQAHLQRLLRADTRRPTSSRFRTSFFDVWPDVQDTVEPIIADALAGRGSYFENLEVELRRYGRLEQAWFTFSYSPIFDEGGSIPGALCVCVETTAQIRAEHRLSGERERLRKMFNQAPGFIAVLDGPDHVFSMANAAYFQLVGRDDIMGKTVAAALPEVAEQGFIELLDSVYKTGEPFVGRATPVRLVRSGATGEERFVDFVFQPDGGSGRRSLRHFRSGS